MTMFMATATPTPVSAFVASPVAFILATVLFIVIISTFSAASISRLSTIAATQLLF